MDSTDTREPFLRLKILSVFLGLPESYISYNVNVKDFDLSYGAQVEMFNYFWFSHYRSHRKVTVITPLLEEDLNRDDF